MENNNPDNLYAGQIRGFEKRLPSLLDWARLLCEADEMDKAMQLLTDFVPGYYRHHVPKEVIELKKLICRQFMTTVDYANNSKDMIVFDGGSALSAIQGTLRGIKITEMVKAYNDEGLTPHLIDMGPGEFWLPIGLDKLTHKFTYEPVGLQMEVEKRAREICGHVFAKGPITDRPVIFVACEIIEHLWNPWEIPQTAYKLTDRIDLIVMSTPLFTYGLGCQEWDTKEAMGYRGHIKTFTPQEFLAQATAMFPEFNFDLTVSEVMLLVGKKKT